MKMVFNLYEKVSSTTKGLLSNQISVGKYGVCFATNAIAKFKDFKYCEVYLDRENNRVGFKPSNDDVKGFKVAEDKNGKGRKSVTGAWASLMKRNRYTFKFEDGFLIIENCLEQA